MLNFSRFIDLAIFHVTIGVSFGGMNFQRGMYQIKRENDEFKIFEFETGQEFTLSTKWNVEVNKMIFSQYLSFPS